MSKTDQQKIIKIQLENRQRSTASIHREMLDQCSSGFKISDFQTLKKINESLSQYMFHIG